MTAKLYFIPNLLKQATLKKVKNGGFTQIAIKNHFGTSLDRGRVRLETHSI